jgi:hypothetical protein
MATFKAKATKAGTEIDNEHSRDPKDVLSRISK